jgi:hypothetical protein
VKIIDIRNTPLAPLTDNVIWINDVFERQELDSWLTNQTPAYIVNDHFSSIDPADCQIYCAPLFLAKNTELIVKNLPKIQTYNTRHIFNFMINKKQVNRFVCMKLIELFNLTNYDYTWSGVDQRFDMSAILNELDHLGKNSPLTQDQRTFLLAEVKIPPKFFYHTNVKSNSVSSISYPNNSWTWNNGLNNMFSSSVVSLITESLSFQKSTVFTEKTAYAVLGKTFPIWVGGGINQAQEFEAMGFDSFCDVIDHSYQKYNTLIERCYYAISRNLRILTDYDYASKIRKSMMSRLEHNQQLIKNKQVLHFCNQRISQWPEDLQQVIGNKLKKWISI